MPQQIMDGVCKMGNGDSSPMVTVSGLAHSHLCRQQAAGAALLSVAAGGDRG